ncbi:MAG: shikimate kinase [Chthoniobacterales bacterium]|jgi:shikimate kinase
MPTRGNALVLIGFMGAGKSSAGRAVAQKLRLPRFDTDEMVAAKFAISISEIFRQFGEARFRDAETEALRELDGKSEAVIVTGGGIVLREENIRELQRLGTIVSLHAREEIIFERVSRRSSRPLLRTENPRATVAQLLATRAPLYRAAADAEIDTSDFAQQELGEAVIREWERAAATRT